MAEDQRLPRNQKVMFDNFLHITCFKVLKCRNILNATLTLSFLKNLVPFFLFSFPPFSSPLRIYFVKRAFNVVEL